MVFNVHVALTWILFLALFPMAFFWLRRAWRIAINKDFSEVAIKHGESPANPEKYAPYEAVINLVAGSVAVAVIAGVLAGELAYDDWMAIAGSTIWCKFFLSFALSRQAHPMNLPGFLSRRVSLRPEKQPPEGESKQD
jgi:ABC-type phosphate transport system permease subunit